MTSGASPKETSTGLNSASPHGPRAKKPKVAGRALQRPHAGPRSPLPASRALPTVPQPRSRSGRSRTCCHRAQRTTSADIVTAHSTSAARHWLPSPHHDDTPSRQHTTTRPQRLHHLAVTSPLRRTHRIIQTLPRYHRPELIEQPVNILGAAVLSDALKRLFKFRLFH
jgi:hypothetical protein